MQSLGERIRELREEKQLPLRKVAAYLDIDQAILSKLERGQRNATREQVVKLAEYFKIEESDFLISWLSDKLVYDVADEQVALKALQLAEKKVQYNRRSSKKESNMLTTIQSLLKKDGRVASAWLFGSYARGNEKPNSDIDIMVEMNSERKYSIFDLIDIAFIIESKIKIKVDLVEKNYLNDFAQKTASPHLIKIYG